MLALAITATILCTNANYLHSPRCTAEPDYFIVNEDGSAWGMLTSGVTFTQSNVINDYTRLQRFQLEDAFWFVSDKGDIWAENELQALSIYLSL
jgi:hypothetical protein